MRLLDSLLGMSSRYFEGDASGAAVLLQAFGSPNTERVLPTVMNAEAGFSNSAVVFGLAVKRMRLLSEAEFKFKDLADEHLFGTPALERLEEPWPGATTGDLIARMDLDVTIAGNAYIRDAGSQLERLRPDWVTIVSELVRDPQTDTEIRRVTGYWYEPPPQEEREPAFYPVEEVAHWSPVPDPCAAFRGMSWITPVLREVDADQQMTDYKRAYLENAATPNLLIKYAQKVGTTKIDQLRDQLEARHAGVGNAFRTMILDEGADPMTVGNSFEQMTYSAVQAAGENRMAVAAEVPSIVAGLKEGLQASTYSNYDQAMRAFGDLFGRPSWRSMCGALAKLVEVPTGAKLWYDTSGVAALRQGDKEQADTMLVLAEAAQALVMAGYTPQSINNALSSGDVTLLEHSGLVSVQMQALQEQTSADVKPISNKQVVTKVPKVDPGTGKVVAGRTDTPLEEQA